MEKICITCRTTISEMWWKCCPKHVTETGPDVVCTACAKRMHPEDHSITAYQEVSIDKQIMIKIKKMVGYEPVGMLDLLHILSHPDVIELTKKYILSKEGL